MNRSRAKEINVPVRQNAEKFVRFEYFSRSRNGSNTMLMIRTKWYPDDSSHCCWNEPINGQNVCFNYKAKYMLNPKVKEIPKLKTMKSVKYLPFRPRHTRANWLMLLISCILNLFLAFIIKYVENILIHRRRVKSMMAPNIPTRNEPYGKFRQKMPK